MMTDLILKGGEVIDPSRSFRGTADVAVENGMITAVGESIEPNGHTRVLDVSGKLVTPSTLVWPLGSILSPTATPGCWT